MQELRQGVTRHRHQHSLGKVVGHVLGDETRVSLPMAESAGESGVVRAMRKPVACWCGWSGVVGLLAPGGRCPRCASGYRLEDSAEIAAEKARAAAARQSKCPKRPPTSGDLCERGCGRPARPRSGDRGLFPTLCESCHAIAGKTGERP